MFVHGLAPAQIKMIVHYSLAGQPYHVSDIRLEKLLYILLQSGMLISRDLQIMIYVVSKCRSVYFAVQELRLGKDDYRIMSCHQRTYNYYSE